MAEIQNLQKNNSIWKSIAAENSIETEIAKSTDSFLREHKKLKCLKSGSGADHIPTWKFYNNLTFLILTIESGKQYINLKKIKPLIHNIGEANIARAMFEQMSGNFHIKMLLKLNV
ncbi:uncharacterized protein LOC135931931 isoform X2 [Gordionus sp. m RMFG-2023]|uniref:uncharacterized protein LOC135931931 isoform X2 n=1 Tax=Gordionus sp. m RMFG-2023 TaxID=3053472 RepID=UPI0031FD18B5